MWSIKRCIAPILVIVGLVAHGEATIRVNRAVSTFIDKTVYIVEEKVILTNTDSPSKGILVMARPSNACKPVIPAPPMPINMTLYETEANSSLVTKPTDLSWVLLVSWKSMDECSIATKAENALSAGYSVIVFEDPNPSDDLEPEALSPLLTPVVNSPAFEYGWTDANVYAYTVDPEDWKILKNNFTSDEFYVTFERASSMTSWFTYLLLGTLVIGAIFFTIGLSYVLVQLLVLILLWIRESIVSRIQQVRRDRRRRLPPSQLKKIPIQQWNSDMLQDICSICLESFVETDRVRILPCAHVFHQACIDPWLLKQRRKCPNCKRKIVFPDENRESDSSSDDERTPLIRRSSSHMESVGTSPQHSRAYQHGNTQTQRMNEGHGHESGHRNTLSSETSSAINRYLSILNPESNQDNISGGGNRNAVPDLQANSSINTSNDVASGSGNNANSNHPDLEVRYEQIWSTRDFLDMIKRRKAEANLASKLDNDSSSDMSTGIQPVLVSVTVEPNSITDSDCQGEEESQCEETVSESIAIDNSNNSQNQGSSSSQLSPKLEVKVVPESPTPNPTNTAKPENTSNPHKDSSIVQDLNA